MRFNQIVMQILFSFLLVTVFIIISIVYSQNTRYSTSKHGKLNTNIIRRIKESRSNTSTPLLSCNEIFRAWYQVIQTAQDKNIIWFTTYVWKTTHVIPPHISYLKKALHDLNSKNVKCRVNVIIDQSFWLTSRKQLKQSVKNTLSFWNVKSLSNLDIHFYGFSHYMLGNVHFKVLLLNEHVVSTSINIEAESGGTENTWTETGIWTQDKNESNRVLDFIQYYFKKSKEIVIPVSELNKHCKVLETYNLDLHLPLKNYSAKSSFFFHHAQPSIYVTSHSKPHREINHCIVHMIRLSRKSIIIATPTFNHPVIWNELLKAAKKNVKIRLMINWEFNVSFPFVQKYFTGYPTNADFVKNKFNRYDNIHMKWYGYQGKKVHRHSGNVCHAKYMIIDDMKGLVGSYNFDVWASLNSAESMTYFESVDMCKSYKNQFNRLWSDGINITKQNCLEKVSQLK